MKILKAFLPLFLVVFLSNCIYSQKSVLKASPLTGTWIELTRKSDTIVFSSEYDGQNPVFNLKRGTRVTEEGFTVQDYYSGPYNFKLGQNRISVYWFLSSGSYQSYYFKLIAGEEKFEIGNFFKDPEKKKQEIDTLVFIYFPSQKPAFEKSIQTTRNLMKKIQFKITIQAPVSRVFDFMLGIHSKSTYEQWTSLFNPTSTYEGVWDKGAKMLFLGIDEKGEKGGMVSRIADIIPNRFVSIQHRGLLQGNKEIMEGPEVEKWANGFENYTFEENNGTTTVTVNLDITEDFSDYMNQIYPQALDKLKELCEK